MNARTWLLVMLAGPLLASAQSAPEATAASSEADARAASAGVPSTAHPATGSFAITDPEVRRVLRDAAISSVAGADSASSVPTDVVPPREGLEALRFRALRRAVRMECDAADQCTAFDADGRALYTVARDGGGRYDAWTSNTYDQWLSCQSTNNMLTTFERFDKCRGITIGLPVAEKNLVLALPRIRLQ
jgi:hypothetical protein